MKKRLWFSIVGFVFLHLSINMVPTFDVLTWEAIMHRLVFEPFKLAGALLLFILGFLAIARVIKQVCEQVYFGLRKDKEVPWLIGLTFMFLYLAFHNFWLTLAALGLSLFYGIMDANIRRRSRFYNH